MKVYTGIVPLKVEVENIEEIPSNICDDLSVGDIVIEHTTIEEDDKLIEKRVGYVVLQHYEKRSLHLVNTDTQVKIVYYSYDEDDGWYWEETETKNFSKQKD